MSKKAKDNIIEVLIYITMSVVLVLFAMLINYLNEEFYIDENLNYIYLVIFIITVLKFFIDNFVERIKLKNLEKKEIIKKIDIQYYRDILKENSPVVLSIVHDRKLDVKKDLNACLLYLENEGYITIDDNIETTGKDYTKLPESLQYIIKKRNSIFSNFDYIDYLKSKNKMTADEYVHNGRDKKLVNSSPTKIKLNDHTTVDGTMLIYEEKIDNELVYIVFIHYQGTYTYFGAYQDITMTKKYNNNFYLKWSDICYQETVNKGYYKERKKYHFSITTIILIIAVIFIPFFSQEDGDIYFIYSFILFWLILFAKINAEINNKYIKTQKGYELYTKLCGLKNYISDFSKLEERSIKEIKLWDEYLIYTIILNSNNNLIEESKEQINNKK